MLWRHFLASPFARSSFFSSTTPCEFWLAQLFLSVSSSLAPSVSNSSLPSSSDHFSRHLPSSPDPSACYFFLWGYLKSKVLETHPADLHNLKQRSSDAFIVIPPAMLLRVMENFLKLVHRCINLDCQLMGVILKT
jgi:hypothetical protein